MALEKARITIEHTGEQFDVMFNPEEYSLNRDNNFASQAVPGLSSPLLQFVHGNLRTLEMELFFDTYEKRRDVRDETQKVVRLLDIDPDLHAPPIVRIAWASLQLRCVLARAAQKFIVFLEDGRPVRAKVTVTFNEFVDPGRESREVKRQTSTFSKVHTVVAGRDPVRHRRPLLRGPADVAAHRHRERHRRSAVAHYGSVAAHPAAALRRPRDRRGAAAKPWPATPPTRPTGASASTARSCPPPCAAR